jgi:uncharacterized RmlC-like cupin family protein
MSDPTDVTCVHPADRQLADPTPGKAREQAIAVEGLWSGLVRTEPGVASGWHHHGDHDTSVYVVEGNVRVEYGPAGALSAAAGPGDFIHIPKHVVHREVNAGPTPSQEIITRSGAGPLTVNVDGPEPAATGLS